MSITVKTPKSYLRLMFAFAFSIQIHLAQRKYIKSRLFNTVVTYAQRIKGTFFRKRFTGEIKIFQKKKCNFDRNSIILGTQYTIAIEKLQERMIK